MELQNTSEAISGYIRKCDNIIHKKGHKIATEFGLTYDQFHLLIYLKKAELAPTINEISNRTNRAQNTTSEMISRLESKGLVERISDTNDRRVIRVNITEDGINMIETIKNERSNRVTYIALAKMDDDEINNLLKNLEKFYDNLMEGDEQGNDKGNI